MNVVAKLHHHRPHLSVHRHRPSFTATATRTPIYSLSFTTPKPKPPFSLRTPSPLLIVRASSSSEPILPKSNPMKPKSSVFSLLKKTLVTLVFTAVFVSIAAVGAISYGLHSFLSTECPLLTETLDAAVDEEKERTLEEYARSHPGESKSLRELLELKIKGKKVDEAIRILDRLIRLDPEFIDWPLMKSYLYCYKGETKKARSEFKKIIKKDPLEAQAYHGLVLAASEDGSYTELKMIKEKVENAIENCEKQKDDEKMKGTSMNFKILMFQINTILGTDNEDEIQDLAEQWKGDQAPYVFQAIFYRFLIMKEVYLEKLPLDKYRKLVPSRLPYVDGFDGQIISSTPSWGKPPSK